MSATSRDWLWSPAGAAAPVGAEPSERGGAPASAKSDAKQASDAKPTAGAPLDRFAFVVDDNDSICRVMAMTLATLGIESETFHTAKDALAALGRRRPAVIFLDVALSQSDAIDVVHGLDAQRYDGVVHLMSGNPSLIEAVQRIGIRKGVTFGVPMPKPFRRETIVAIVEGLGLTRPKQ
jgi:FixJ family two-component response regulator